MFLLTRDEERGLSKFRQGGKKRGLWTEAYNDEYTKRGRPRWTQELLQRGYSLEEAHRRIAENHEDRKLIGLKIRALHDQLESTKAVLNAKLNYHPLLLNQAWKRLSQLYTLKPSVVYMTDVCNQVKALVSSDEPIDETKLTAKLENIIVSEEEAIEQRMERLRKQDKVILLLNKQMKEWNEKEQKQNERIEQLLKEIQALRDANAQSTETLDKGMTQATRDSKQKFVEENGREVLSRTTVTSSKLPKKRSAEEVLCKDSDTSLSENKFRKVELPTPKANSSGASLYVSRWLFLIL